MRFTGYTECGITDKDQRDLSRIFVKLTDRGCKVLLSNSDTPHIRELYKDFSRHTQEVNALRSINSSSSREKGIKNYLSAIMIPIRNYLANSGGDIQSVKCADSCSSIIV